MLRTVLLSIAVLVVLSSIAAQLLGIAGALPLTLWSLILLAALLFERWRYRPGYRPTSGPGDWQETGEKFVDPETRVETTVLYNPATGERRYVAQAGAEHKP